jgi:hypothetical protein
MRLTTNIFSGHIPAFFIASLLTCIKNVEASCFASSLFKSKLPIILLSAGNERPTEVLLE